MGILLGILTTFVVALPQDGDTRIWRDSSGAYSTKAKMEVKAEDEVTADVVLIKESGERVTVPFNVLDAAGQRFAKQLRQQAKNNPSSSTASNSEVRSWNWRGPNGDGISTEEGLMSQWPQDGPPLDWSADGLGKGLSSLAIADGKIFTLGNRGGSEHIIALSLQDGSELWATRIGNGGDPNSTPTYHDGFVYGLGRGGDLCCVRAEDGQKVWSKNFAGDFGGKMMSQWGYSESPLVDDGKVICTPGGPRAMIVALNYKTGQTIWSAPMPPGGSRGKDGAGYSSPVVSNGGGIKQYITLVGRGLISVDARTGRPLWQYEKIANGTANVPTPIVDGNFVFCSSGYSDGGTALLQLTKRGPSVNWREVYYFKANQLQNHHGGMIKIGDYVYMGEGHNNGFPTCVSFRTGQRTWPKQRGAGERSAAIVAADGHLYFRYENGVMALIEANPQSYNLKGSFQIASRNGESWPHPVIYDGKLYLRDQHQLHCYSIKN
ncbi:MAG: PQQ-binding-like beta-propeller repeat protein [Planctomycetota bacterium]